MKPFKPIHMLVSVFCAIFSTSTLYWAAYNKSQTAANFPEAIFIIFSCLTVIYTLVNIIVCFHALLEPFVYDLNDKDQENRL